ncbi:MAG: FG-GAP repeat protein, partial [Planctomycetes bacterium]|nr:FG-GAP repeat protein [Planctomycetota bacterium]
MMAAWRVNGNITATAIFVTLTSVISVNGVQGDTIHLPSPWMTMAIINAVSLPARGLIDCNENGVDDAQDIADMTSADCNGDGRPDECGVFVTCDEMPWLQEQSVTGSDAEVFPSFGGSVSISDDVAILGARLDFCEVSGQTCGSAHVFRFDGSTWIEEQVLFASDGFYKVYFGFSVSVSGETALVGSIGIGILGTAFTGAAYVFRHDGTNWVEVQKLLASDGAAGDEFGESVAVSGDVAVIGARLDDDNGIDFGSAYVYRYDGTQWVEEQKLLASDGAARDRFGNSVAVSGDVAVIGAGNDDDNGFGSG